MPFPKNLALMPPQEGQDMREYVAGLMRVVSVLSADFGPRAGLILTRFAKPPGDGVLPEDWEPAEVLYFAGDGQWEVFGDPGRAEDPKTYHSGMAAFKATMKAFEDFPRDMISPSIWVHPEAGVSPLEKYQKMDGRRLPGSPTQ